MCGIAGVIARDPTEARAALTAMNGAQVHRGPDDDGAEFVDAAGVTVGLGQRRLAIIDLSPMGHQPMAHSETGDLLTYNGELYNYMTFRRELEQLGVRFRGHSDTEVMLHALVRWGPEVLRRFEGMYAILWYRRATQSLVIARDPLGIKPLYVSRSTKAILFASEVRGLLATGLVDRRIDRRGLAGFLAYGAVQDPHTFFESVRSFPAGSWQEFDLATAFDKEPAPARRHWSPPRMEPALTEPEAVARLRRTMSDAVRDHLISDVPVGVFLSSGLDSTIVAGLGARHMANLKTYTVGFADNPDMSESPMAGRTAAEFGLPHVDVQITGDEALSAARRWLGSLDQPSMDGLNTYVVAGAVKRAGITVALSGLGGDEIFCGYHTFEDVPRIRHLMSRSRIVPAVMRGLLARLASRGKPEVYRQKLVEMVRGDGSLLDLYFQRRRTMSGAQLEALGIDRRALGLTAQFMPLEALADLRVDEEFPVGAISLLESRYYTGNMLLRDSDTNGMAHSLEIRVPMFDKRVLDGFLGAPGRIRMPMGRADKHLLRAAFPEFLRPELLLQRKRGFALPVARWMGSSLRDMCEDAMAALKRTGIVRAQGVDSVWRAFLTEPASAIWSRAFTLVVLGAYIDRSKAVA